VLPEPTQPAPTQHGVDFLIQTLATAPRPITLAALGPLTNLAVALIQAPQLVEQVAELVIMGGAITQGNITPSAEFNIFVDPHAAQVVLAAGWPITLITLETTHQVLTTPARLAALRQIGTPVAQVAADLLTHYGQSDIERYGMAGAPLHDPCVIAYLLQPELFSAAAAYVTVETTGRHTLGRTVVDSWGLTGQSPNARVVQSVNVEGLYDLLLTRLGQL
jgi:purine nucleosidase